MKGPLPKAINLTTQSKPTTPPKFSPIPATQLIKFYTDKGLLKEARDVFDETLERDVVTWTAMIAGYVSHGHHEHAWAMFVDMIKVGQGPNAFTISSVLKACKGMGCGQRGALAHGLAVKNGVDGSMHVGNALLDVYATCGGSMDNACMVFDGILARTAITWTTMIAGYTRRGDGYAGIQTFRRMLQEGVELNPFSCSIAVRACASVGSLILGQQIHSAACKYGFEFNLPVANSLVDMYCRCMCLPEAKQYFDEMHRRDLITWNTLIAGFERNGSHESLQLFSQMGSQDLDPNCFTFTSVASACANLAVLNCGKQVHGAIIRRGFSRNLALANALLDMYSKCGSIGDSCRIFNEMPQKDLLSWTSMMIGYGTHGYGREAIELFDQMVGSGIQPDRVVFMGVLSACSHTGLVNEGLKYFASMGIDYHIVPDQEIYGCIVDMLSRAGRVTEAYNLIERMPFEADESVWGALLGACKVHRNMDLGRLAAEKILDLRPKGAGTYVILSNIYAADGKWGEFAATRRSMRGLGCRKEAGRSWIEMRNQVCSFVVGERTSPHLDIVYEALEMLNRNMKLLQCESDSNCLLHDLEEGI
ncbi:putative pentatricopeptide repeat-containing protein At1g56570 [Magnolia sinica]|uniref:putative pentatricopeptide repeat-containing protein At1g56570 n=1 Tax=Magnolia sinica TaxID=86752 RepID=UPI00265A4345|nr:putative pentatricopeptide repeat-containing protein At1g56570 [Magnolia sinica]